MAQVRRTEEWFRFTLVLDETPARRIRGLRVTPTPGPDAPTALVTDADIVAQIKGYVERLASRDAFSGTVLLAKAGKSLCRAAFGQANKDFGVNDTVDTKFNLGSMNKMFTAVSVLQLAEKGKLSLEDTLGKFLSAGMMRPEVLSRVRIKHRSRTPPASAATSPTNGTACHAPGSAPSTTGWRS